MSSITGSRYLIAYRSCPSWFCRRCEKCPAKISTKRFMLRSQPVPGSGKITTNPSPRPVPPEERVSSHSLQRKSADLKPSFARPGQTRRLPLREHSRSRRRPRRPRLGDRALSPAADKAVPTQRAVTSYLPFHGLPNTNRSLTTKLISEHVAIVRTFATK